VAEPDEKASACAPPDSREARVASRTLRLRLGEREYSSPCGEIKLWLARC
jgi:hypothetical protein